jgi:hypothetical protein
METTARLIEPSVKYYLQSSLQSCHNTRVKIYSLIFNASIFILFVLIVGGILYYSYKNKPTEYEKQQKMMKDQEYILSKIKYYQTEVHKKYDTDITQLPTTTMSSIGML